MGEEYKELEYEDYLAMIRGVLGSSEKLKHIETQGDLLSIQEELSRNWKQVRLSLKDICEPLEKLQKEGLVKVKLGLKEQVLN